MKTWFTSDHHFGHANIIKYCNRPFNSVGHMNAMMEFTWNSIVSPDDLVYYLGDFAMNPKTVPEIVARLHGKKILIPGNHDRCYRLKSAKWVDHYLAAGFESVEMERRLEIAGESVLLNHLPYRNTLKLDLKFFELRPVDHGGWLIHGHVHDRWKVSRKQINVSADVWSFEPVSWDTITEIIRRGPVDDIAAAEPLGANDY
jgi:calcineurin-like phosphoesterase family protein